MGDDRAVPRPACRSTCMVTTWEKIASGTASRMEKSQMDTALRHVQKTALEVWMSIGLTMALYLVKKKIEKTIQKRNNKEMIQKKRRLPLITLLYFLFPPAGGGAVISDYC